MNQDDCVHVCVRIRPTSKKEKLDAITGNNCVRVPPTANGTPPTQLIVGKDRPFTFDIIHNIDTSQEAMYSTSVTSLVEGFMEGYNATVLAYGQTGTGKTYTMSGGAAYSSNIQESHGVIPRTVCHIFRLMKEREKTTESLLRIEYLEIYNEELRDLLHPETTSKQLSIREDAEGHIIVAGAKSQVVQSPDDVMRLLSMGSAGRVTGSTNMNEQSSRSHAIFTLALQQKKRESGEVTHAKFHLVDLAGSERAKRTGAVGGRFKESVNINQGLLALGNVISALGDDTKKKSHVPYRDSKLTRLLQDSLGGNSKTLMIACVSPVAANFEETLNTIKYANRAKNIKNRPVVNHFKEPPSNNDTIERMKHEIEQLQSKLVNPPSLPQSSSNIDLAETQELQRTIDDLTAKQQTLRRTLHSAKSMAKDGATSLVSLERDIKSLGRPVQQHLNDVVKLLNAIVRLSSGDDSEQPESNPAEEVGPEIEHYRVEIQALREKLQQDVEIFELKSREVEKYQSQVEQLKHEMNALIERNSQLEATIESTRETKQPNDQDEPPNPPTKTLFRHRSKAADDDTVLIADVAPETYTNSIVLQLQEEIVQLKTDLRKAQEANDSALFTSKEPPKQKESKLPSLVRAQTAGYLRTHTNAVPPPPKTADPTMIPLDKASVHAMFQTQLLAAVECHVKNAQVATMLSEKEETTRQKDSITRRKHDLEMEKLRQSLSVQSSITDLSQSIHAMNKRLHASPPDPEELARLKRRKERAEKKLALFVQKIENQSYVEPAVQEELTLLEEQIQDLESQILFQDGQLEIAKAEVNSDKESNMDHILKHLGGEGIDIKLRTWIQMCWTELVQVSIQMKSMQSSLQHQEELVSQLTQNRLQLENGLNAARAEYDRRLVQYELLQAGDKKQIEELTVLLATKQNQLDELQRSGSKLDEKTLLDLNHLVTDAQNEINALKKKLVDAEKDKKRLMEYDRYVLERQTEWETKRAQLQQELNEEREQAQKTIEQLKSQYQPAAVNSNQEEVAVLKDKLQSQQEYVLNLEKHVLLFKNKAKQTQLQLQQLIRDSAANNQNTDENKQEESNLRIQQLETLNESLMKENAAMKVHLRAMKAQESSGSDGSHVRIRVPKSELKEINMSSEPEQHLHNSK